MNIIRLAFGLLARVMAFSERARRFYYAVMLTGHECPRCGSNRLEMLAEGKCRCRVCGDAFDPTVAFDRCLVCGGKPVARVRRYQCETCGTQVASRFLFDGLVFDAEYFRQKMAESRQRKRELRDRVREMLAASRSQAVMPEACDLGAVPGLAEALRALVDGGQETERWQPAEGFDLKRYQRHLEAHIGPMPLCLEEIPPLGQGGRKDLVWRFIAIIFMAHAGRVGVWQEGSTIWVMQRETDGEGQDVSGDLEATRGLEGPLGRIEA